MADPWHTHSIYMAHAWRKHSTSIAHPWRTVPPPTHGGPAEGPETHHRFIAHPQPMRTRHAHNTCAAHILHIHAWFAHGPLVHVCDFQGRPSVNPWNGHTMPMSFQRHAQRHTHSINHYMDMARLPMALPPHGHATHISDPWCAFGKPIGH